MKHITVDEIIGFVSFNRLDEETRALASKVNLHIIDCPHCLRAVNAFQAVYDELDRLGQTAYFKTVASQMKAEYAERECVKKRDYNPPRK